MTAGPPPWRVFDSPAPQGAPPADDSDTDAPGHAARPDHGPTLSGTRFAAVRADVVVGLGAALGGLVLAWLLASGGPAGSISLGGGTQLIGSADPGTAGSVSRGIVVDVVGAVLRPGVYHLAAGSRIGDAIAAAGGFGPRVAADRVDRELNLAAPLHDGELVAIPSRDESAPGPSRPATTGAPGGARTLVDLNSASESELDALPGIGPVTAAKIVASRSDQPFRSVDELLQRKLVGQKTFDSLKGLVTVGS